MADQGSEGLLSPFLRARRLAAVQPYLRGRVLDVGCGSGAMAALVPPDRYVGVEPDVEMLELARQRHPQHRFLAALPDNDEFDTVASLAVIEHVRDSAGFLGALAGRLNHASAACIVCTTPHPAVDWLHTAGARCGLFSRHASEEHEELLDHRRLQDIAECIGLHLTEYRRFLMGGNQLAVFGRNRES